MKNNLLAVFLCISFLQLKSQDLLLNGGFEQYSKLPDDEAQWQKCKYWNELIGDLPWPSATLPYSTPDFFNEDGLGASDHYKGFILTEEELQDVLATTFIKSQLLVPEEGTDQMIELMLEWLVAEGLLRPSK